MILKNELLEGHQAYLEYEISSEVWENAVNVVLLEEAKRTKVPGFRLGKAPLNLVASRIGEDKIFEYASEDVLRQTYPEILKEAKIKAYRINNLQIKKNDFGRPKFSLTIDLEPEVKIKKTYEKMVVDIPKLPTLEEEINLSLKSLQHGLSSLSLLEDSPAEKGRVAHLSYTLGEGGKLEKIKIDLGKEEFYPGFDEQIEGMMPGEEREVILTIGKEILKGKVFLEAVYERKLPELDEDFAKRLGYPSLETLLNQVSERAKVVLSSREREIKTNAIVGALLKEAKFQIPAGLIEDEAEEVIGELLEDLEKKKLTLEKYLELKGKDMETFKEEMKEIGKKRLEFRLLLEKLATDKELTVTEEEIQKELGEIAKKEGLTDSQLKSRLRPDGLRRIRNYLLREKMLDLLLNKIKVKEV